MKRRGNEGSLVVLLRTRALIIVKATQFQFNACGRQTGSAVVVVVVVVGVSKIKWSKLPFLVTKIVERFTQRPTISPLQIHCFHISLEEATPWLGEERVPLTTVRPNPHKTRRARQQGNASKWDLLM